MKQMITAKDWPGLELWARAQIAAHAEEARFHLALGMSLANQARPREASAAFRLATELAPGQVEGWYNLCLAGAQIPDRTITTYGLDGVTARNLEATKRLLELPADRQSLGSDEPAAREDFSHIQIKYQPPAPRYPPEAKARRIQGVVVAEVTVDRDGRVIQSRAISGPEDLRAYAANWILGWRFYPIPAERKDDRLVFQLTMPFRLH
jgi:TonB family protein